MAIGFTIQAYREIYFILSNKTLLSIDENAIHDFYNNITYYWKDIKRIRKKHGYLYLSLYNPGEYLNKIGNLRYRTVKKMWFKPGGEYNEFLINISIVDIDRNVVSTILIDYSAK